MEQWSYNTAADHGLTEAERLRSVKREAGLAGFLARNVWWRGVRAILRLRGNITIIGKEHFPAKPPFVLVANHSSHLDTLVLATALPSALRNVTFPLAAGDTFFETPGATVFATGALNALPMWRKNCGHHAIDTLRQRLIHEPCGYILFPEGTRSRTGVMTPFRHGIGMLVAGLAVPVTPCHLRGTFQALPPGAKWLRASRITLRIGKAETFEHVPCSREGWETVAHRLQSAVQGLGEV